MVNLNGFDSLREGCIWMLLNSQFTVSEASRGARRFSYFLDRVENNLNLALKPLHSARQLEMGVNCILARISTLGYLYHYACTTNTTAIYLRGRSSYLK
ncbi:hypothetical protein H4Q26_010014 [Puccinia striiformis f. sp. tritici PST-130]|nr:hypothetical protein H4Q26_010014 [Puccinia striiformis f. sp. tritici PST-130]